MIRLPRLELDGNAEATDAINEIVVAIESILRMRAAPPLRFSTVGAVPTISLDYLWKYVVGTSPSGGIAARSGSTCFSGRVPLQRLAGGALTNTGEAVDAYNLSRTAVSGGVKVGLAHDGDVWWVAWEDC